MGKWKFCMFYNQILLQVRLSKRCIQTQKLERGTDGAMGELGTLLSGARPIQLQRKQIKAGGFPVIKLQF